MKACIDFGNTRGKIAFFDGNGLLLEQMILPEDALQLEKLLQSKGVKQAIVSTVAPHKLLGLQGIWPSSIPLEVLGHSTGLPIKNAYQTPETLGMDRLAAVVGAWALFPGQASLVVDMGTCITYDFISDEGVYLGGAIAPGMRMRSRAMHEFTAALPEVVQYEEAMLTGVSTETCLRSGVVNGVCFEVEGHRRGYKEGFEIFNTVLCGGDAHFFESKLKAPIFVRTELVAIGLNAILDHLLAQ